MRKRILSNMLILVIVSVLVSATAMCIVFYNQLASTVENEVRGRAALLKDSIGEGLPYTLSISDMRLTLINTDGYVKYDDDENAALLPNHSDREEVKEALKTGTGESKRFSDTLGQETYYYALKLSDGSVLRVAKTMNSILGIFGGALPVVIGVVILICLASYLLAGSLTKRIVEPINNVDFSNKLIAPYDELSPFIKTIADQRGEIIRHMESLRERSDTIEAILASMSEGVLLLNRHGKVISANKSVVEFFGLSESVNGRNIRELYRDIEFYDEVRNALSGSRGELSIEHEGKTYRIYFNPVSDIGAIILFMDITEKAKAEVLRREFSANVSHELKTPLTTIYGNAEMLSGGMVREEDKAEFYSKIKNESERLMALIEDIILISKLDEGTEHAADEDVELSKVAKEATEALAGKFAENNISVEIISAESVALKANHLQIYELFYNLVDNAIKYNKPDGNVEIHISKKDRKIEILVADTGIGIPKEAQSRVFERFYRVDKSRYKQTGGTGLGLAIVKHIAMAYGGEVSLESKHGGGTKIKVCLPC